MENNLQKFYQAAPTSCKQLLSLNVLLTERAQIDDGIKKEINIQFPENYYNRAYHTRYSKKILYDKIICIKQVL